MKYLPIRLSIFVLVLAIAGTTVFARATSAEATRPNIVVFLVDDMGVMDTSLPFLTDAQGQPQRYPLNDFYRTPNMEKLAATGIRFSNFYAMSVCSPTRASIMTGQNAARHHTTQWISPEQNNRGKFGPPDWNWEGLREDSVTLPRILQSAGYRTIHVGKGHFGPFNKAGADPANLGFDVNIAGRAIGVPGSYSGRLNYGNGIGKRKGKDRAVPHLEKYHGTDMHLTDALTLEAESQIDEAVSSDTPFFLYLAHYAVHSPHQSDPRFADHYVDSGQSQRVQNFATLVEGMDKSLGDLLAYIRERGIGENTLILFLGDNGTDAPIGHEHAVACAAPLRGKKGSHYEGGVRVPFVAAWATPKTENSAQQTLSIPAGAIQSQMGNVCDLLPTIVELTGAPVPNDHVVDGTSLTKLLAGEADAEHSSDFLMHFPHEHRTNYYTSLRSGDWKVIHHDFPGEDSGKLRYQLFNLASDPFEQTNLAENHPDVLKRMMLQLTNHLEQHNAQYIMLDSRPTPPQLPSGN
ncbi:Arylsulfatase A [Neorhodopirellula lusitana]|uniref:Arylsulfatase A n=1 Tax=Neorhodopirellula lusitana TaxID=445327 RepID=A0ABY1PTC1_9BACT|nr:sulfatase [Neorhodopirellula lusitana]SMP43051.1 Arylsulfatase A [Neorhodopirellula lusitana]